MGPAWPEIDEPLLTDEAAPKDEFVLVLRADDDSEALRRVEELDAASVTTGAKVAVVCDKRPMVVLASTLMVVSAV